MNYTAVVEPIELCHSTWVGPDLPVTADVALRLSVVLTRAELLAVLPPGVVGSAANCVAGRGVLPPISAWSDETPSARWTLRVRAESVPGAQWIARLYDGRWSV